MIMSYTSKDGIADVNLNGNMFLWLATLLGRVVNRPGSWVSILMLVSSLNIVRNLRSC